MPVFECVRCNNLTYSASRFASIDCGECGATRHRALDQVFSFDEARAATRTLGEGDHCCVAFDAPEEVATLCADVLRSAVADGARVIAHPPQPLRARIEAELGAGEMAAIEWSDSSVLYNAGFDPDAIVASFRELAETEGRPVYVLGGPDVKMTAMTTLEEWERFERLITDGIADLRMTVVCAYDRSLVGSEITDASEPTHPLTVEDGPAIRRNERFAYVSAESSPSST